MKFNDLQKKSSNALVFVGSILSIFEVLFSSSFALAQSNLSQKIPENQSLNILDYSSQIVSMDYEKLERNPSSERCKAKGDARASELGDGKRALYYYHRDSNFLGAPDGPGHCYLWIYDSDAPRNATLSSILISSFADQIPPAFSSFIPNSEELQRKVNGIHFRHFGFHAFESSDVCLKKVNSWRLREKANWAVWSHQGNNCLGIMFRESFVANNNQACFNAVQGKIAWNHDGNTDWESSNVNRLCAGAERSIEPGICFDRVMHDQVNWGNGTRWRWENALNLCRGATNASTRIENFKRLIRSGSHWGDAIRRAR